MGVKPLADRVLIKEIPNENKDVGGIILPDSAKDRQQQKAEVVELGTGEHDFAVAIGDTVITRKGSGTKVTVNGEDFTVVKEEEIIAVLN